MSRPPRLVLASAEAFSTEFSESRPTFPAWDLQRIVSEPDSPTKGKGNVSDVPVCMVSIHIIPRQTRRAMQFCVLRLPRFVVRTPCCLLYSTRRSNMRSHCSLLSFLGGGGLSFRLFGYVSSSSISRSAAVLLRFSCVSGSIRSKSSSCLVSAATFCSCCACAATTLLASAS